jgi:hypothetical protein
MLENHVGERFKVSIFDADFFCWFLLFNLKMFHMEKQGSIFDLKYASFC